MAQPAKPKKAPPKPIILKLRVGDIDLSKAVPMLTGDWTALANQGVKLGPNSNLADDPHALAKFVHHFAAKVNPAVTHDMILEEVPITRSIKAVQYIHEASEEDQTDPN